MEPMQEKLGSLRVHLAVSQSCMAVQQTGNGAGLVHVLQTDSHAHVPHASVRSSQTMQLY